MSSITDAEYLLALRAPSAGQLSVLLCQLTEALKDPGFSKHHRLLVAELLTRTQVTPTVARAAQDRMQRFAAELAAEMSAQCTSDDDLFDLPVAR